MRKAGKLTVIARIVAAIGRAEHGSAVGGVGNGGNRRHDSIVHKEHCRIIDFADAEETRNRDLCNGGKTAGRPAC